ncbi:hypothetical protein E3N88_26583 [Mikania micrantha]|uniref:Uncharacterized protein n=1 Tax=Mikania micrantha TaxID=192012 RepID=A0A5N6MX91_9ASTR|nr:hypothetical protein E3N88_26583 [Mikania micrantha]
MVDWQLSSSLSLGLSLGLRCSEIDGEASLRKSLLILKAGNVVYVKPEFLVKGDGKVWKVKANDENFDVFQAVTEKSKTHLILGWQKNMEEVGLWLCIAGLVFVALINSYSETISHPRCILLPKGVPAISVVMGIQKLYFSNKMKNVYNAVQNWWNLKNNLLLGTDQMSLGPMAGFSLALARFVFTRGEFKVPDCYRLLVHMKSLWMMVVQKTWPIPVIKVAAIRLFDQSKSFSNQETSTPAVTCSPTAPKAILQFEINPISCSTRCSTVAVRNQPITAFLAWSSLEFIAPALHLLQLSLVMFAVAVAIKTSDRVIDASF